MRSIRDSKGFTLIELMIVVVIIGILAAIAIPKFNQVSKNAKQAEAAPVMKQICTLAQTYEDQNGEPAEDVDDLISVGWSPPTAKYFTFDFDGTSATADPADDSGQVDPTSLNCETGEIS